MWKFLDRFANHRSWYHVSVCRYIFSSPICNNERYLSCLNTLAEVKSTKSFRSSVINEYTSTTNNKFSILGWCLLTQGLHYLGRNPMQFIQIHLSTSPRLICVRGTNILLHDISGKRKTIYLLLDGEPTTRGIVNSDTNKNEAKSIRGQVPDQKINNNNHCIPIKTISN